MDKPLSDTLTDRELVTSLSSDVCPACGATKVAGQTLCRREYRKLARDEQLALYDRLGNGYREAVLAAMATLGKTEFLLPLGAK